VFSQKAPDPIVGALGVPHEHARVEKRGLFTLGETRGALEVQQLGVVLLGESLLSAPERSL
jgi:hypothetical protein